MKKLLIALGLSVLTGTAVMAVPISPPPIYVDKLGIDESESGICYIFHGKGETTKGVLKSVSIAADGSITIKCSSDGKTVKPTKKAVKYDNMNMELLCLTISSIIVSDGVTSYEYQETDDWQNVVSASGMSSLICHYREVPLTTPAPI